MLYLADLKLDSIGNLLVKFWVLTDLVKFWLIYPLLCIPENRVGQLGAQVFLLDLARWRLSLEAHIHTHKFWLMGFWGKVMHTNSNTHTKIIKVVDNHYSYTERERKSQPVCAPREIPYPFITHTHLKLTKHKFCKTCCWTCILCVCFETHILRGRK